MPFGFGDTDDRDLPPGSLGWPFLGEALTYARNPHKFFESRARKHGSVFKTRILGSDIVCFVGPEPFTHFVDNPNFTRDGGAPGHVQELLCQRSLPLLGGDEHASLRDKVAQVFNPGFVHGYLETTGTLLEAYAERWVGKRTFHWVGEYKQFAASVCASLVLGAKPVPDNNDDLSGLLDRFMAGMSAFPLNLPFTTYGRALSARDLLLSMIDEAIAGHREPGEGDMLSRLVEARGEDGAAIGAEELRAQVLHTFFAAYGGLFRVLSLMCMNLAQHPGVRQRAAEEVDSIAATGPLSMERLLQLEYVEAVTREVRRHNRIFASNFFDRVTGDSTYGGYRIPVGWKTTGAIYQTMQDETVFAEPSRFDPERFLPPRSEAEKQPNAYIPHGGGALDGHRCPAEDLATLIMVQAAAMLLRSYQWELAPGQDLSLNDDPSPLPKSGVEVMFFRKLDEAP